MADEQKKDNQLSAEREMQPVDTSGEVDAKIAKDLADQNTKLDQVKIYSPFRVYYDAPALSVTAESGTGVFDILPGHKNFMTLLLPCEVVVRAAEGEQKLKIDRGVMHVRSNKVSIFLDV